MNTELIEQVRDEMRRALELSGVSQNELARRIKCNGPNVSHMLAGRRNLTLKTIDRMAKAIGYRVVVRITK